jgi:hypothetical protein
MDEWEIVHEFYEGSFNTGPIQMYNYEEFRVIETRVYRHNQTLIFRHLVKSLTGSGNRV